MMVRHFGLGLLLLVSADFTNPYVGGAFTFDSTIEGLRQQGSGREARQSMPAPQPPRARVEPAPFVMARVDVPLRPRENWAWPVDRPRARVLSEPSISSSEDH